MSRGKKNDNRQRLYIKKQLRIFREKKGFSQSDIAKMISVSQSDISRWEDCEEHLLPDIDTFFLICESLGVSINDFVIEPPKSPKPATASECDKVISCYNQLSIEGRKCLKEYLNCLLKAEKKQMNRPEPKISSLSME